MSARHQQDYCAPWQVALRQAPGATGCSDPGCDLSGGYAHAGECAPCDCGKRHAIDECPVRRGMALTSSEIALAKVLAAWEGWQCPPVDGNVVDTAMVAIHVVLGDHDLVDDDVLTTAGRALLDRARKTGVL